MWRMERHVPRGGGNSLKPSHNHGLWQIGVFNNLALWGEKKFVSELKRTYKLKRPGASHVALCDGAGSYFSHWCGAFTLAEVLITLGIIGVVAALTMPTLIAQHQIQQAALQGLSASVCICNCKVVWNLSFQFQFP